MQMGIVPRAAQLISGWKANWPVWLQNVHPCLLSPLFLFLETTSGTRAWGKLGKGAMGQNDLLSLASQPDVKQTETNRSPKLAPGVCPMGCATPGR